MNNNSQTPPIGIFGKFTQFFVWNHKLSLLLFVFLFGWGLLSFYLLPKQYNPEIVAPAFRLTTMFPGASVSEVTELISKPLEDVVSDIDGVDEVSSQSYDGGISVVMVKFFVGEDSDASKIKLQQKLNSNVFKKPIGAEFPLIQTIDPDTVPILTIALTSPHWSPVELRRWGMQVAESIRQVDDTASVEVVGGRKNQLSIELDPQKMRAFNLSLSQFIHLVASNNERTLIGGLETDQSSIPVQVNGWIDQIEKLQSLVLTATTEKRVTVADIATIKQGPEPANQYVNLSTSATGNQSAVMISVAKKKGSNSIKVADQVLSRIDELKSDQTIPENIQLTVLRNEGQTARNEINGLMINLIQAILIVSLVLFLFLDRRPALIVAVVIPLTLAVVFAMGLLGGQTINRITLFALILSLGLLVDNATVVIENILRHLKKDHSTGIKTLVVQAVDEVGSGLFMSTVTTVLAFVPMAFVTGMMGPYMGPIPFFVPVALIASLFIALSINPWLSSVLLERSENPEKETKKGRFNQLSGQLMHHYQHLLHRLLHESLLRKKVMAGVLIVFTIVMSFPLIGLVKFRMLPKADRDQFYIYLDLPEGSSVDKTQKVAQTVVDYTLENEQVVSVQSFIGTAPIIDFNGLFKGAEGRVEPQQATLKVNLIPASKRSITSEALVLTMRSELNALMQSTEPDARLKLIEDPPGPPVLATMLAKVQGSDSEGIKHITREVEALFQAIPQVVDLDTTLNAPTQQLVLQIDQEKASVSQLSVSQINQAIQAYVAGKPISPYHNPKAKEQEFIVARLPKQARGSEADLQSIFLKNTSGDWVPLSAVVTFQTTERTPIHYRDQRSDTQYIMAEMGDRSVTYATIDAFKKLWNYKLPSGQGKRIKTSLYGITYLDESTNKTYQINWGGEWELTLDVFRDLGLAMLIAIGLIYFVLVAQFHSFKTPLIIMGTIPLAMIGVMPGFALLGFTNNLYFNATSMIGVIALAGIVVNNAIILLEYLNGLRQKGYTVEMALIEAGSTRLRPILLTTATTVLGSLTIIGDPVWAGLAWSIIFGLTVSAVLTLVIFPILYFMVEKSSWKAFERESVRLHGELETHGPALP